MIGAILTSFVLSLIAPYIVAILFSLSPDKDTRVNMWACVNASLIAWGTTLLALLIVSTSVARMA